MDLEIIDDNDLPKGKVIIQSHKHTEQLPDIIACMKQLSQNKLFPGKYQDDIYYICLLYTSDAADEHRDV